MPNAAIFGAGPAGLLTALACDQAGYDVTILSNPKKSRILGAQFTESLPADYARLRIRKIEVQVHGTPEGYREKVYGPGFPASVHPPQHCHGYDLRALYDFLWDRYCGRIVASTYTKHSFGVAAEALGQEFDIVFSSIPLADVCENTNHTFDSREIFVSQDDDELMMHCPVRTPADTVTYAGGESPSWARAANLFNVCSVEWPALGRKKPPLLNISTVTKPLNTNCTCFPGVVRVGRYGEWRHGVMAMDAYRKAQVHLRTKGVQGALF